VLKDRSKELLRATKSALRATICADVRAKNANARFICADVRLQSAPAHSMCAPARVGIVSNGAS